MSFTHSFRFIYLVIFVMLTLLPNVMQAQLGSYMVYNRELGLRGSSYQLEQDRDGNIWIASSYGIEMFDGNTFTQFTVDDGLASYHHYKLHKDQKGNIWFIGSDKLMSYYDIEQKEIRPYAFNDSIKKHIPYGFTFELFVQDSIVSLYSLYGKMSFVNGNPILPENPTRQTITIDVPAEGEVRASFMRKGGEGKPTGQTYLDLSALGYDYSLDSTIVLSGNISQIGIHPLAEDEIYLHADRWLLKITPEGITSRRMDDLILDVDLYNGKLLVAMVRKGLEQIDRSDLSHQFSFHRKEIVSGIFVDNENSLWVSIYGKFLCYYPASQFTHVSLTDYEDILLNSVPYDNKLVTVSADGDVYALDPVTHQSETLVDGDTLPGSVGYLGNLDDDHLIFTRSYGKALHVSTRRFVPLENDEYLLGNSAPVNDTLRLGIYRGHLKLYDSKNLEVLYSYDLEGAGRVSEVLVTPDGNFLTHGNGGLCGLTFDDTMGVSLEVIYADITVRRSYQHGDSIFLVDEMRGLFLHTSDTFARFHPEHLRGIKPSGCVILNDDLWLSSYQGLYAYNMKTQELQEYSLYHGLESLRLRNVFLTVDSSIWVETDTGFDRFDPEKGTQAYVPGIVIDSLVVDGVNQDTTVFSHDAKLYQFHFTGFCLRCRSEIRFEYRLVGQDDAWISSAEGIATYHKLPPKQYRFEVRMVTPDDEYSEVIAFPFEVSSPFYTKAWFIIVCVVLLLLISGLIYWLRLRALKKHHHLVSELQNNQQRMIGMQMNPHFIFNSLNSIQTYIFRNDAREANNYIVKFGKLMRTYLNNSAHEKISLSQEITSLQEYIELENLRLKEGVSISFDLQGIDQPETISIPIFFLQPILENAVWHGIAATETPGQINVRVSLREAAVRFEVRDNGNGLNENTLNKSHRIRSTQINKKRLLLLSDLHQGNFQMKVENRVEGGEIVGVCTTIDLPLL